MQKTDWYANKIKPVRPGVYEVEWRGCMGGVWFNYWDGRKWFYGSRDSKYADNNDTPVKQEYRRLAVRWRGIKRSNANVTGLAPAQEKTK